MPLNDPAFSEAYCKAVCERDVPASILAEHYQKYKDKPKSEQKAIKDSLALEIVEKYPYKPGKDPRSKALYRQLWKKGLNENDWFIQLETFTDEEISCLLNNIRNGNCAAWIRQDREDRPDVSDRERAEEIRDGKIRFSDVLGLLPPIDKI